MKLFITKYKSPDNKVPNYFQSPKIVVVDYVVCTESQILEDGFDSYTDELQERDNPFSFTSSDYNVRMSLIRGITSNLGKTLKDFFDPETDNYMPVGFKVAWGEDENNIERGDLADIGSVKCNLRKDDKGYILSYTCIGAGEEFIKMMSRVETYPLPTTNKTRMHTLFSTFFGRNELKNITLVNYTVLQLQQIGFYPDPYCSFWLFNKYIAGAPSNDQWSILLSIFKDLGMCYNVAHPVRCNPAVADPFEFHIFFPSSNNTVEEPVILDGEDIIEGITLDYSKPHLAAFYVSYTFQNNSDVDILSTAYISRNVKTIGYSNIDGEGFQNDANNFRVVYSVDRFYRNGEVIPKEDIFMPASNRVFIGTFRGHVNGNLYNINVGISIGRCFVREHSDAPSGGEPYTDSGFNQVIQYTVFREYEHLVSGIKKYCSLPVKYPVGSPHKLYKNFPWNGRYWNIKRVIDRNHYDGVARLYGAQK